MTRSRRTSSGRKIQVRVLFLVALGMLLPMAVMAWAGWRSVQEFERRATAERELLARLVTARLNAVLRRELQALEAVATLAASSKTPTLTAQHELHKVYVRRRELVEDVFLIDAAGRVALHEPSGRPRVDAARLLKAANEANRPDFTGVMEVAGRRMLYALVPVHGRPGESFGVIGAAIEPGGARLTGHLQQIPLPEGMSMDLLDEGGTVFASTDPKRVFRQVALTEAQAALMAHKRAGATGCTGWEGRTSDGEEVFSFCSLSVSHWGVTVQQPASAAYTFIGPLSRNVLLLAAGFFALALLFGWGASLSVTRPLATLTSAAERLAAGELAEPIPDVPADEVGGLRTSLERMRVALKESLEGVERANVVLEERVRERTAELQQVNAALQEREAARRVALSKVISAQEDERKRIARELHDETSQSLVALVMALQLAEATLPEGDGRKKVDEARQHAVRTLDEVHRLIVDLRPSVLDDLGLRSAILWYAERCLRPRGISVRCEFSGLEARLPQEVETAVFRCAQESMTNIARHAEADDVLIQCARREGRLELEIEDDGKGFAVDETAKPDEKGRGFGLLGIRERVELLGGTVKIESAPGQGTRVLLSVPVPEPVSAPAEAVA